MLWISKKTNHCLLKRLNQLLQKQLADQFVSLYSDCVVKKIDDGNYLDINLPILHPKKGTHIWFNTPKAWN